MQGLNLRSVTCYRVLAHAGYQWIVVVFFVFIFAANIFLRTAASIASIFMCRRNDNSAPAHADGNATVQST